MNQGVWTAPGRVNLIGEHTDYNDGFVMPLALDRGITATARRRDDGVLRLSSAQADGPPVSLRLADLAPQARTGTWADYPAGVAWALRAADLPIGGAEIHYTSTLPSGAGLSSSAALEVVTALALGDLYGAVLAPDRMAALCQRAENAYVGAPTGILDQTASACCREGHALWLDTRTMTGRQLPLRLAEHGLTLLVVDSGVRHAHSTSAYGRRRAGCETAARALGVPALRDIPLDSLAGVLPRLPEELRPLVRHVVTENDRVERVASALSAGRPAALGPLLSAGHRSLRDDFQVSCVELDVAVEASLEAGALGARMTGGGFGGSAIVLVETAGAARVTAAVEAAFTGAGRPLPGIFPAAAGGGARRVG
ncbi:galactokinase [Streptomyces sp. NPDC057638]|uniref:galactokinase n=1 Tax=Streptomyces sp. NPDC057638 TaxID=3346190 RepID=UPI0036BF3BC6